MTDPASQYGREGYALIERLVTPEVATALLVMIQHAAGTTPEGYKGRAAKSSLTHKKTYEFYGLEYRPAVTFHWALTRRMERLTGSVLAPSYMYYRVYQAGDVCRIHSDRPACEHSLSLTLAYADDIPWDFAIGTRRVAPDRPDGLEVTEDFGDEPFKTLTMQPGDAILYRGPVRRHGRLEPNPNRWSAHMFLHWVDPEGPYREFAFERTEIPPPADYLF